MPWLRWRQSKNGDGGSRAWGRGSHDLFFPGCDSRTVAITNRACGTLVARTPRPAAAYGLPFARVPLRPPRPLRFRLLRFPIPGIATPRSRQVEDLAWAGRPAESVGLAFFVIPGCRFPIPESHKPQGASHERRAASREPRPGAGHGVRAIHPLAVRGACFPAVCRRLPFWQFPRPSACPPGLSAGSLAPRPLFIPRPTFPAFGSFPHGTCQ